MFVIHVKVIIFNGQHEGIYDKSHHLSFTGTPTIQRPDNHWEEKQK